VYRKMAVCEVPLPVILHVVTGAKANRRHFPYLPFMKNSKYVANCPYSASRNASNVPTMTIHHASSKSAVTYVLSSVVYGEITEGHYLALHIDVNGGKWAYDPHTTGLMQYVGNVPWSSVMDGKLLGTTSRYTPFVTVWCLQSSTVSNFKPTPQYSVFHSDNDARDVDVDLTATESVTDNRLCNARGINSTSHLDNQTREVDVDLTSPDSATENRLRNARGINCSPQYHVDAPSCGPTSFTNLDCEVTTDIGQSSETNASSSAEQFSHSDSPASFFSQSSSVSQSVGERTPVRFVKHPSPASTQHFSSASKNDEVTESSISTSDSTVHEHPCFRTAVVGELACRIPQGFHGPHMVNLTEAMFLYKPIYPWSTANLYYEHEFLSAVELLRPHIANLTGGDCFFKLRFHRYLPDQWCERYQPWPPNHAKSKDAMKQVGIQYLCDHHRLSGCEVVLQVMREYTAYPDVDMYSIKISKGWHRMACNHVAAKNTKFGEVLPALHPVVDMFIRKKAQGNASKSTNKPIATVLSRIENELVNHLRSTPVLHCDWPHVDGTNPNQLNKGKHWCKHAFVHHTLSGKKGFSSAMTMPAKVPLSTTASKGIPAGLHEKCIDQFTTIDKQLMQDGHSQCGSHVLHELARTQIKSACTKWTKHFSGDAFHSDNASPNSSSIGALHEHFTEHNIFARWEKMIARREPKQNDPDALDPFQWGSLGLLYREKSKTEVTAAGKRKRRPVVDADIAFDASFLVDDPEVTDPRNLPYELVAVNGSIISLIISVKAWATREVAGQVQICADNMYNGLKGVPNMYWFNTGIMDAKGIHFPTVNALTLGRAKPRNKVFMLFLPCALYLPILSSWSFLLHCFLISVSRPWVLFGKMHMNGYDSICTKLSRTTRRWKT
jgi:hypothetical protein